MSDVWHEPPSLRAVTPIDVGPTAPPHAPDQAAASGRSVHEPVLVTVGDIVVSQHWAVTPNGTFPLAGSTWTVTKQTSITEGIPAWAIVITVLFVWFCFLGLLFLLVKERRLSGWVTVTVQGPAGYHATQVAVSAPAQIADAEQRVHHIRSLVVAARHG